MKRADILAIFEKEIYEDIEDSILADVNTVIDHFEAIFNDISSTLGGVDIDNLDVITSVKDDALGTAKDLY